MLAPLDQVLSEAQATIEEQNKDKMAELRHQQEFMSDLETHISRLGGELQELRNKLQEKEEEYNACCSQMAESIQKVDVIEGQLEESGSEVFQTVQKTKEEREQVGQELDQAHEALDKLREEARTMQSSRQEFDDRAKWVAGILQDTHKHIGKLEQVEVASEGALPKCQAAMIIGGQQGDAAEGPSQEEELTERIQELSDELASAQQQEHEQQRLFQTLEERMAQASTQLSELHAQKAAAVSGRDFKQATALSQSIRALTETSDEDSNAVESAMAQLDAASTQVSDTQQALSAAQQELYALQSSAANLDEPPGCASLRQLSREARSSGESELGAFLQAELAIVLACAKAAQGYPDWENDIQISRSTHQEQEEGVSDDEDEDEDEHGEEEATDLMALWTS